MYTKGSFVKVNWVDIVVHGGWAKDTEALGQWEKPSPCETRGWLVDYADDYILVAATKSLNEFNQYISIPRGCIISVEETPE